MLMDPALVKGGIEKRARKRERNNAERKAESEENGEVETRDSRGGEMDVFTLYPLFF